MSGFRLQGGGLIDRSRPLRFRFDGRSYRGLSGDTVTSALMASGVDVVGRSFKYHRPRGIWGAWTDDPNAIFDIGLGTMSRPNCHGATTRLEDGMDLRAVNAWPSARLDVKAGLDRLSRFLPAGFYYKTFMWPNWHLFEPGIRRMAGLGRLRDATEDGFVSFITHDLCDVLVVGGGVAGLRAARRLAESGRDIVLVDDRDRLGGVSASHVDQIEGVPVSRWVDAEHAALLAAGGRVFCATTANGIYDHGLVQLLTRRGFAKAPALRGMRAKRILLATGSVDRPMVFDDNDRPGVMSVGAALDYAHRYGVLPGRRIAVLGVNAAADAQRLERLGADVFVPDGDAGAARAHGTRRVRAVTIGGRTHACDTLLSNAGPVPQVQLWCQAGGKLDWDPESASFRPGGGPAQVTVIGAARGQGTVGSCLEDAERIACGEALDRCAPGLVGVLPKPGPGRRWVDLQNDVTARDVALAARENYTSVEHLKRYTTLGMGTDQGRISNVNGLALLAESVGKPVPEVGTTRFRPPCSPVELEAYRGIRRGTRLRPLKRTPLESEHRALGAALGEYGGWLRPAWYGEDPAPAIRIEAERARRVAGFADATPLGKIEVLGPDAADFLNFIYYNTVSTLRDGAIRYGFMLTEHGAVYDDGVLARLAENHFLVSCSSSHADGVAAHLEGWRQDGHDPDRVFIHDVTQSWCTVAVAGPRARDIVAGLDLHVDLSPDAFPHMAFRTGGFEDRPARVARVSFTGEASYEISVPSRQGAALWRRLLEIGEPLGAGPLGMEAQAILRAEKGYVIVGKDTDGETMPQDLGFDAPLRRKKTPYVGDRGLRMPVAQASGRRQLVGLKVAEGQAKLPEGAHIVRHEAGGGLRSEGFVTSSYDSVSLGAPIGLASLRDGSTRMGEAVTLYHMGATMTATVVPTCFLDPDGKRLHA